MGVPCCATCLDMHSSPPQIAKQFSFRGKGVYRIYGVVRLEYDCVNIEVIHMEKMEVIEDPRYAEVSENKKTEDGIETNNRRRVYWDNRKPKAS